MLRLYRLLLLLQPRELRRRYGAEMEELVRERARESASAAFWAHEILDALRSAAAARRAQLGWMFLGTAIAHSAYAAAVFPLRTMGIAAILLTAGCLLAGAAMIVTQPRHRTR